MIYNFYHPTACYLQNASSRNIIQPIFSKNASWRREERKTPDWLIHPHSISSAHIAAVMAAPFSSNKK